MFDSVHPGTAHHTFGTRKLTSFTLYSFSLSHVILCVRVTEKNNVMTLVNFRGQKISQAHSYDHSLKPEVEYSTGNIKTDLRKLLSNKAVTCQFGT